MQKKEPEMTGQGEVSNERENSHSQSIGSQPNKAGFTRNHEQ